MYTLITFATQWGSRYGGINSFNTDFLTAFGVAYHENAEVICIVGSCSPEDVEKAAKAYVKLLALPYVPESKLFDSSIGATGADLLNKNGVNFEPNNTIWLGHDLITGEAAVTAAKSSGSRSAVIHHMSYSDYESYAEDSESADRKTQHQITILQRADLILAVGPLLRDAANDRLGGSKPVHMLIPGLAEIDTREAPKTFVAYLSGRVTPDAARIKQSHLGIAAFAAASLKARTNGSPDALRKQPKLLVRGVDFENQLSESDLIAHHDRESEPKQFAEQYANAVINLQTLPYIEDRDQLYSELSGASVSMMPSWHEGFGLVGWEAIAAGVPLIIGQNTGLYRFLEEEYPGAEKGYVYPIDVQAQTAFPYFRPEDLENTVKALTEVAVDPAKARKKASTLRNMLLEKNRWDSCGAQAVNAFGWDIQKGSVPDRTSRIIQEVTSVVTPTTPEVDGSGPLKIPQGKWRSGVGMADSQLLRAEEALLPFDPGREPDVEKLKQWVDDPAWPLTIRLITGAGGQGKTRLAIHLCQQLQLVGWHAGFLHSKFEPNQMNSLWQQLSALKQPILIAIDYAETRQSLVLSLLRAALQSPTSQSFRVLLLARDGGEWWDNLPSKDSECEALLSGYATSGPYSLTPLYTNTQSRQEAFSKALTAFARILQVSPPALAPDLVGDQFERPLFVQMAALLSLYGERPLTAQGLTKALLNHERRYWIGLLSAFNWPDPGRRAEQLLALATLVGGFVTPKIAETFWTAAKGTVLSTSEFNSLFRNMATLYPGTQGLQALRPDLLGEALVAQALLRPEGDVLLDSVLSSSTTQMVRRNALTVLARISNERVDVNEILIAGLSRQFGNCGADLVAVSRETASRLPELAEVAFERLSTVMKNQVAGSLKDSLEEESVQLAGLSCLVFEHLAHKAKMQLEKKPTSFDRMFEYAAALDEHGVHLGYNGDEDGRSQVAEESVKLLKILVTKDRNRFEPSYARSLGNYSSSLRAMGNYKEARETMFQVLEIYKRLAQSNPKKFERHYAIALNNYANRLSDAGEIEETRYYDQQALEIRRRLARDDPDSLQDYASSLLNYSARLSDLGENDEALLHADGALRILRRLAQERPDRFEPAYASALSNYATTLNDFGRNDEALGYAQEAMSIQKRLIQKNPDRFQSRYSLSLNYYAHLLGDMGQYNDALESAREALAIDKQLTQKNPKRFESDYAVSLGVFASRLSDLGKYDDALACALEETEILRRLAPEQPTAFSSALLSNFYFVRFQYWVSRQTNKSKDYSAKVWSEIPSREQNLMRLYSSFVEACEAEEHETRKNCFRQVLVAWKDLFVHQKRSSRSYWLCAAAWSSKFDSLPQANWQMEWQQFSAQRQDNIPVWMLEVARRLDFEFPHS